MGSRGLGGDNILEAKTFSKIAVGQSDQTLSCSEASSKVRALCHSPWMSGGGIAMHEGQQLGQF